MLKSYHLVQTKHQGRIWTLPANLMSQLKLTEKQPVLLKCGSASTQVHVSQRAAAVSSKVPVMGLSADALNSLNIPEGTCFLIKPEGNSTFRLGPVIGILTFPGHVPYRLAYYTLYARRNVTNGLLYVFRGRDINLKDRTILGYYYDPVKKTWFYRKFPFPDSVIDRCYPNAYICHTLLQKIIGPNKIFNKKTMIDKVAFCKALDSDEHLRNYTPETRVFRNIADFEYFLKKYGQVFLKPVNAMKGIGIVMVAPADKGVLNCSYIIHGKLFTRQISSVDEIPHVLVAASGYKRPYIVQQAIPRLEYKGGPFSFRTWAMKNGKGRWVMPGMFAKGSLGNSFLTNFTAGAKLIPLKELFDDILPRLSCTKDQLLGLLEDLTLKTAEVLDKKYGPLGELGLDIVFDIKGKPWIIEANGNPGNIPIFIQKEYPAWRNLVFQYPLDYATYLAGFKD